MYRIKLLIVVILIAASPVVAQNVMQSGKVDDMVSLINSNPGLAKTYVEKAIKADKENTDMIATIGSAYLKAGKIDEAEKYFLLSKKCYKISTKTINLGGDIALAKNNTDSAKYYYGRAMYFNKRDPEAYFKYAEVVKFTDMKDAISKLNFIKMLRPDLPVDGKIAELYYGAQNYTEAIARYESLPDSLMTENELVHYAQSELLSGNYEKALQVATRGNELHPHNTDLVRLMLYCNTDQEHYEAALENAKELLDMATDTTKIRYTDYLYYGYVLNGLGHPEKAIEKFELARAKAKNVPGIDKDIATAYQKIGDYDKAIKYTRDYLATITDSTYDRSRDLFQLGMLYWRKATSEKMGDELTPEKIAVLKEAEAVFGEVSKLRPDSYVGYYWRAKANALMDPKYVRGLAKPYYQQALEILERDGGDNDYMIECYKQLSYYYYIKKVMPMAVSYAEKIIKLDPEDSYAKQLLSIAGTKK